MKYFTIPVFYWSSTNPFTSHLHRVKLRSTFVVLLTIMTKNREKLSFENDQLPGGIVSQLE